MAPYVVPNLKPSLSHSFQFTLVILNVLANNEKRRLGVCFLQGIEKAHGLT